MDSSDEFQKRAFELWMAVTMFISTYAKENNAVVKHVSEMLPYATDLQNFWTAYQSAQSNELIRKLHTKIRSRVKLMKDILNESINACGDNQKLLDKYSENQNYIERKLNAVYALIPKEPRKVQEPEQMVLEFDAAPKAEVEQVVEDDGMGAKSEKFLKRLNELKTSISGFLSSYSDGSDSVVCFIADAGDSVKIVDSLWRRYLREHDKQVLDGIGDSLRKSIESIREQCEMSVLVRDSSRCSEKYVQNHDYVMKKLNDFTRAFPLK